MTFEEYLTSLQSKTVAIIGIGVSNTPLIKLLLRRGVRVTACDCADRAKFANDALLTELESMGATLKLGESYLDDLDQDIIFRAPGIRPDIPAFEAAKARGSVITSEMEVFFRVCPCKRIAVTGSDGKTTTTIIAKLLEAAGYTVHLGGNIGRPLLPDTASMKESDIAVLELSSFQLMTMDTSPEIAVVTNLSPNHLDVHKGMEEYIEAKKNIFTHQSENGKLVLNYDNDVTNSFIGEEHGVKYYNDSISSSPSRTVAGLHSFKQKVILIAGGCDKHNPYDVMGDDLVAQCKATVLTGATAEKIRDAALNAPGYDAAELPIYMIDDFADAATKAVEIAEEDDIVSASFDTFKNFVVRGNYFKEMVVAL